MGRRGQKSTAPGGVGSVSEKGYIRVWDIRQQRLRMQHVVVWEERFGPVPAGVQIHHKNENKLDNRIENLEALTPLEHKREHSGCELRDGEWWKPCKVCGVFKPLDREHWYFAKDGRPAYSWCRPCHVARVVREKQARRAAAKGVDP